MSELTDIRDDTWVDWEYGWDIPKLKESTEEHYLTLLKKIDELTDEMRQLRQSQRLVDVMQAEIDRLKTELADARRSI